MPSPVRLCITAQLYLPEWISEHLGFGGAYVQVHSREGKEAFLNAA